jgi:hypothetical protein
MGCDTKGYIKGATLQDMMQIVSAVLCDTKPRLFHEVGYFSVSPMNTFFDHFFCNFRYGENIDYTNPWRPVLTDDNSELRRLFFGAYVNEYENERQDYMDADGRYGHVQLGASGHASKIMRLILCEAQVRGFEVWFQENDCGDEPVKL